MHDAHGNELKIGDKVVIPAVITKLHGGEDFCNVSVETAFGRRPDGHKEHFSAINTAVMIKVDADGLPVDPTGVAATGETEYSGSGTSEGSSREGSESDESTGSAS